MPIVLIISRIAMIDSKHTEAIWHVIQTSGVKSGQSVIYLSIELKI
jgi:hypothetical protein